MSLPAQSKYLFISALLTTAIFFQSFITFSQTGLPNSKNYEGNFTRIGSVWGFVQDQRGILYFTTDEGVFEYDGVTFTKIPLDLAIGIAIGETGEIYVSSIGDFGKLETNSQGVVEFKSLLPLATDSIKLGVARWVLTSKTKAYCISTKVLLEYDKVKKSLTPYFPESGSAFFNGFIKDDVLYLSSKGKGLMMLIDGKLIQAPYGEFFVDSKFGGGISSASAIPIHKDTLLLGYGSSLIRYHGSKSPPSLFTLKHDFLSGTNVYGTLKLNDKYSVINARNKGMVLIDKYGNDLTYYNDSTCLPGNVVVASYSDKNDNIWMGLIGAKYRLVKTEHGQDMSSWDERVGLKGGATGFVKVKDVVYGSTTENLFIIDKANQVHPVFLKPTEIRSLAPFKIENEEGVIAITPGEIKLVINGASKTIYKIKGAENLQFATQSKKFPNRIYVQSEERLSCLLLKNNEWKYSVISEGSFVTTIYEDTKGSLWMNHATRRTVIRIDPKPTELFEILYIKEYTTKDGLPEVTQNLILNGENVFMTADGLYYFNQNSQRFERWEKQKGKFMNLIHRSGFFEQSPKDRSLVIFNTDSLFRMYKNEKGDTIIDNNIFKRLPRGIKGLQNLYVDIDGDVWICESGGLVKYDLSKDIKKYDQSFGCYIRKITLGKDSVLFGGGMATTDANQLKINLNSKFGNLIIRFAAPFFDKEEETLYSYTLEGNDNEWSSYDKQTFKEYTGLFEGKYTFKVKSKNVYGVESSVASFSFVVAPPWYRSWWAYGFYAICLALFVLAMIRWRTRALNERRKELENLVNVKTRELVDANHDLETSQEELRQSNDELMATNDYLQKTQRQLVESEKMASLGQLTAGIAHEINNPINFISGGVQALEMLQEDLLENRNLTEEQILTTKSDIKDLMNSIHNGVNRTASIVNSLKIFSTIGDDTLSVENVEESIEHALVLVSNRLKQQEILLVKEYHHHAMVRANSAQISQVLINILDNAIRAVAHVEGKKVITITTEETDDEVMIKVKDNGVGIQAELRDRIFEPFFTTREVGSGTGLGLYICYSLVKKNNGKISFQSEVDNGTEFTISLPIGGSLHES